MERGAPFLFRPTGPVVRPLTMAVSFGVWPLAVALTLHGASIGVGSIGLMALPVAVGSFRRIRDLFPLSPQRSVVTGYIGAYLAVTVWVLWVHWDVLGVLFVAAAGLGSARAWLRADEDGVPVLQAQADRAHAERGTGGPGSGGRTVRPR